MGRKGRPVSYRNRGLINTSARPCARGKFLWIRNQKLYVRGVTYGTFQANNAGELYPQPAALERDIERMVRNHINAIRTYDVPPRWLLDLQAALRCPGRRAPSRQTVPAIISSAFPPTDGQLDALSMVADVESALGGEPRRPELAQAALLLVQAVQPILDRGGPDASRILLALRSDPLRGPTVAKACAAALLNVQRLATALSSAAAKEAIA